MSARASQRPDASHGALRAGLFTGLWLAALLLGIAAGARGDVIDFESGFGETDLVPTITTPTNVVDLSSNGPLRIAKVGAPAFGFLPDDLVAWGAGGSFFATDRAGQAAWPGPDAYELQFDRPVGMLRVDVYDFRAEGVAPNDTNAGDSVTLTVYRDAARTQVVGADTWVVPIANPPEGNVVTLMVASPLAEIRSASIEFTSQEITTGIDSIEFATIADGDYDGLYDPFDNCPELYNPSQQNVDGDAWGDYCDNCRHHANDDQMDSDGDGLGDVCEPSRIILRRTGSAFEPQFDLYLECGPRPVANVNIGVLVPFGVDAADSTFGGGCQRGPVPLPGLPPGPGCMPNPKLGASVDPSMSGVWGPSLPPPYLEGFHYVSLFGQAGGDGRLCDPYESPVFLGRFEHGPAVGYDGESAFTTAGLIDQGVEIGEDTDTGSVVWTTVYASAFTGTGLELLVKPAAGEDPATASRWAICVGDGTSERMHRVSLGMIQQGAGPGDLTLEGCDTEPDGEGKRDCPGTIGATVDPSVSFTVGPDPGASSPRAPDAFYVVLEGAVPAPGAKTLNPTQFTEWCLGNVEVASPPGVPGVQPVLTTTGLDTLPFHDGQPVPFQTSTGTLDELPLEEIAIINGIEPGDDTDADGQLDSSDNCPFQSNFDLANNGDFLDATPNADADGDACECADANGSGAVFGEGTPDPTVGAMADLRVIREHLVGLNTDPAVTEICSVFASPDCDTQDAVVLDRAIVSLPPGVEQRCDAALPD